jgi:hypothetical protein
MNLDLRLLAVIVVTAFATAAAYGQAPEPRINQRRQ